MGEGRGARSERRGASREGSGMVQGSAFAVGFRVV